MKSISSLISFIAISAISELGYTGRWDKEYDSSVDYLVKFIPNVLDGKVGQPMTRLMPIYEHFRLVNGNPPDHFFEFCHKLMSEQKEDWIIQIVKKCFNKFPTMKSVGDKIAKELTSKTCNFILKFSTYETLLGPQGNLEGPVNWALVKAELQKPF